MPNIFNYTQIISRSPWLFTVCHKEVNKNTLLIKQTIINCLKYTLQKNSRIGQYSELLSKYYLNVFESLDNVQKSTPKQSKALKIYSTSLLFSIYQGLIIQILNKI